MGAAIFNIVVGLVCLVGGATGQFALIGTNSTTAMAVVGGVILAIGIYQAVRHKQGR